MEHRNQDTTELIEDVSKEMTGSANVIKVADTSVFPVGTGATKILIGNDIYTYGGKTAAGVSGATVDSFTAVTHTVGGNSSHDAPSLIRSYDESYNATSLTGTVIAIDGFGFRDKARTPIASLHSMQIDNYPPLGLKYNEVSKKFFEPTQQSDYFRYIKSVGGMYFGALDSNLRFSKYGTPEYWPLEAVITLDSEIRCIEEHAGEGIVFTTNSVYRVRGTDPKTMIVFRVPDARGIPAGYEHTVSDYNGGLVWLTASDGLAMYSGGKVTYLTRDKHNMEGFKSPHSCVVDGVYWLFQEPGSGTGYRLELTAGEMRLGKTSIEAYYAYYAKALGMAIVITKDGTINSEEVDSSGNPLFIAEEVGGKKATNMSWKSKKIDTGEPAIPKALGSIAVVYEVLDSKKASGCQMRGQALAASLLKLDPSDLNAGDMAAAELLSEADLYSIFTKYDEPGQSFTIDMGGDIGDADLSDTERRTILMPLGFDTSTIAVGDRVWNELLADNTIVKSVVTPPPQVGELVAVGTWNDPGNNSNGTYYNINLYGGTGTNAKATVTVTNGSITNATLTYTSGTSGYTVGDVLNMDQNTFNGSYAPTATVTSVIPPNGVVYPSVVLNNEPLRTGVGTIYWGNLPKVEIYLDNDDASSRSFTLPPGNNGESLSMDLYLKDLKRFRTISVSIEGNVRVKALSLRHYPLQRYQSATLHHSADVFYRGDIDFRIMLDGNLIYRKGLSNAGDEFKEERIYLPASSFGQRAHYMNESRTGMIESVKFNGTVAA